MNGADEGDGRWLTYGQLAEARQIGRRAAIRLAQRHRLRRQPGNDGQTRIWVPTDMASSSPHRPFPPTTDATSDHDDSPPPTPFHAKALAALEDASIRALREQLAAAERRADTTTTNALHRAADAIAAERQRADAHCATASTRCKSSLPTPMQRYRQRRLPMLGPSRPRLAGLKPRAVPTGPRRPSPASSSRAERALPRPDRGDPARRPRRRANATRQEAAQAAEAFRLDEQARKARGLLARLRAVWGE